MGICGSTDNKQRNIKITKNATETTEGPSHIKDKEIENQSGNKVNKEKHNSVAITSDVIVSRSEVNPEHIYKKMKLLGRGGFGEVWLVTHKETHKDFAMKIIKKMSTNPNEEKLLMNEIQMLKSLDHPKILKVLEFYSTPEQYYIITEYCALGELFNELRKVEKFDEGQAAFLMNQIFRAVAYCHSQNVIHRDLKPENILIKSITDTVIKVIDFGSSSFIHDALSSYIQSRSYRAPEVIMGCNYDYKIDMWSLGCILAELYTGNVLFQSDSVQALLARVIGIIGPIPNWMFEKGKTIKTLFTKEKLLYMEAPETSEIGTSRGKKKMHIIIPKRSCLKKRLHCSDESFVDFVKWLLNIDPNKRPTAKEALNHKWLTQIKY